MKAKKLTIEDINKVRKMEGFPVASDDQIIELSDPPHYTACPNPFIKDFVDKYGHKYDEQSDEYKCEPFSSDVSEGKSDPIYMAHSYHTKVPYRAIKKYIMHYTLYKTWRYCLRCILWNWNDRCGCSIMQNY